MARQNKAIQFVDENHTGSFVAEAIAKQYIQDMTSSGIPENLIITSTGTQVGRLQNARRELRNNLTERAKKLAKPYIETAVKYGYEDVTSEDDLESTAALRIFMDYLIGDHRNRLLAKILRAGDLIDDINGDNISKPRQTSEKYLRKDDNPISLKNMQIYTLNENTTRELIHYYRGTYIIETVKSLEKHIDNISFTPKEKYWEILDEIRSPVEKVIDSYLGN